jgi:hypothetical protein
MKAILFLIALLFSLNVFAIDFRTFDVYKTNNALLASDIGRLETLASEKHPAANDQLYKDTLVQFKLLQDSYAQLNSPLLLKPFINDAIENGWNETATRTQALMGLCEGNGLDLYQCLSEINKLKIIIVNSKLKKDNKDSINAFFDNYMAEVSRLSVFDDKFVLSFNENARHISAIISAVKNVPAIVVKVTPVKKLAPALKTEIMSSVYTPDIVILSVLLFSLVLAVSMFRRNNKSSSLKRFYAGIFKIGRQSKVKIKLFGNIDSSKLLSLKKIEKPLLESIQHSNVFTKEAHLKFESSGKIIKIETTFISSYSLSSFVENENDQLKQKINSLQAAVNDCQGELVYCNSFNTYGQIVSSKVLIELPA